MNKQCLIKRRHNPSCTGHYPNVDPALVCVAVGASHVNDSGLWIVKEYFGMSPIYLRHG